MEAFLFLSAQAWGVGMTRSLGLWMLFLWIQSGVSAAGEKTACGNDTGILGQAVELKCCYPGEDLKTNPFRVQWQLEGNVDCVVDAYLPGQITSPQCEHYKNRTELKNDYLHLQLLNLSLEDCKIYECILQKKEKGKYQKIFHGWIRLEVAANNSANATKYVESPPPSSATNDKQQQTRVVVISCLAATVAIITIIIFIQYKRKRSRHRAHTAPVHVDMS